MTQRLVKLGLRNFDGGLVVTERLVRTSLLFNARLSTQAAVSGRYASFLISFLLLIVVPEVCG